MEDLTSDIQNKLEITGGPLMGALDVGVGMGADTSINSNDVFNDALLHNSKVEYQDLITPQSYEGMLRRGLDRLSGSGGDGSPFGDTSTDSMFFNSDQTADKSWYSNYKFDDYYDRTGWDWESNDSVAAHIAKETTKTAVTGAGVGMAVGGAAGALAGGVGAAPGAAVGAVKGGIIGGILGAVKGFSEMNYVGKGGIRNMNGKNQHALAKGTAHNWFDGTMKMVHSANSMFSDGLVDSIIALPEAITTMSLKPFYDSSNTRYNYAHQMVNNAAHRTYHSKSYEDSYLTAPFHSEWWADSFLPNVGYLVGGVAQAGWTTFGMGKFGLAGNTTSALRGVMSQSIKGVTKRELMKQYASALWKDVTANKIKNAGLTMTVGTITGVPEAMMEATNSYEDNKQKYIEDFRSTFGTSPTDEQLAEFAKANSDGASGVFLANTAINGASNVLMFGDLMGLKPLFKGFGKFANGLFGLGIKQSGTKALGKGITYGVYEALSPTARQVMARRIFRASEKLIPEAIQESTQGGFSKISEDYVMSRFNPKYAERNKSFMEAVGTGFHHAFMTEEGIKEGLWGALFGGIGSIRRGRSGGLTALGQGEVTAEYAKQENDVQALNETSEEHAKALERLMNNTDIYQSLSNEHVQNLMDKFGSVNAQLYNSSKAKEALVNGDFENARVSYRNALMAKVAAEKRAGIDNSYNMEQMIMNMPLDMDNSIRTEEEAKAYRENLAKTYAREEEMASMFYDIAEQFDFQNNNNLLGANNMTEMAALTLYQGANAMYDAKATGQVIEDMIGEHGIASSMMYYANMDGKKRKMLDDYQNTLTEKADMEKEKADLMSQMSKALSASARQPNNQKLADQIHSLQQQIDAVDNNLAQKQDYINNIEEQINHKSFLPDLTNGFGNGERVARFFDQNKLAEDDKLASDIMGDLAKIDTYINDLTNPSYKSEEEFKSDMKKAQMLANLVDTYKNQQSIAREYGKTLQMITDPAFMNGSKPFWKKKIKPTFDFDAWIDNNTANLPEQTKAALNDLRDYVKQGKISELDAYAMLVNAEIFRIGDRISKIDDNVTVQEGQHYISNAQGIATPGANKQRKKSQKHKKTIEKKRKELLNKYAEMVTRVTTAPIGSIENLYDGDGKAKKFHKHPSNPTNVNDIQMGDVVRITDANGVTKDKEVVGRILDTNGDVAEMILEDGDTLNVDNSMELEVVDRSVENKQDPADKMITEMFPETKSRDEMLAELDEWYEREEMKLDEIEKLANNDFKGVNPVLDNLSDYIDEVLDRLTAIDDTMVDLFGDEGVTIESKIKEYENLLSKPNKTQQEQDALKQMAEDLNKMAFVEGTVLENDVRLSDLLDQKAQLERETFDKVEEVVHSIPTKDIDVFKESLELELFPNRPKEEYVGNAGVTNNYAYAVYKKTPDGVSLSNIGVQEFIEAVTEFGLADAIPSNISLLRPDPTSNKGFKNVSNLLKNAQYLDKKSKGDPNAGWEKHVKPGDKMRVEFTKDLFVEFTVDSSRRINLTQESVDSLNQHSNVRFDENNSIKGSSYYTLVDKNGNLVRDGFGDTVTLDEGAAQRLKNGDSIHFEIDVDGKFNKGLLEELGSDLSNLPSDIYNLKKALDGGIYQRLVQYAHHASNAKTLETRLKNLTELNKLMSHVKTTYNVPGHITTLAQMMDYIDDAVQKSTVRKANDSVRQNIKDNMLIYAVDSQGNRVGVVKALGNSKGNGRTKMDYLRTRLFEEFEANNFQSFTSTTVSLPVVFTYMGIPNNMKGKNYNFGLDFDENTVSVNKIKGVAYVTTNGLIQPDGQKTKIDYNYAKEIIGNAAYTGKNVPVVFFEHAGKMVAYPITFKPLEGEKSALDLLEEVVNDYKSKNISLGEYVKKTNALAKKYGLPKTTRMTSLNHENQIDVIRDSIKTQGEVMMMNEFLNGDVHQLLMDRGQIDINIHETPFIGAKVRFDLNQVQEISSPLLSPDNNPTSVLDEEVNNSILEQQNSMCE